MDELNKSEVTHDVVMVYATIALVMNDLKRLFTVFTVLSWLAAFSGGTLVMYSVTSGIVLHFIIAMTLAALSVTAAVMLATVKAKYSFVK